MRCPGCVRIGLSRMSYRFCEICWGIKNTLSYHFCEICWGIKNTLSYHFCEICWGNVGYAPLPHPTDQAGALRIRFPVPTGRHAPSAMAKAKPTGSLSLAAFPLVSTRRAHDQARYRSRVRVEYAHVVCFRSLSLAVS